MTTRQNPTDQNNKHQWDLYNGQPTRIERFEESESVTIFGRAPSGAHVADDVWIIWRETIDEQGRVTKEYAQDGINNLVWIYASSAFDPVPNNGDGPYQIILDNNCVFDGMVATLPVANVTVLDPTDPSANIVVTVENDPNGKFAMSGQTLILADTVYAADVAYPLRLKATDPAGNEYTQLFAIYVKDPLAPPANFTGRLNNFQEFPAVVSATTEEIFSYTVPADRAVRLRELEVFGKNRGTFIVKVDGTPIARKDTPWLDFDTRFNFDDYVIEPSEEITIEVTNNGTNTAYYNARLLGYQYAP